MKGQSKLQLSPVKLLQILNVQGRWKTEYRFRWLRVMLDTFSQAAFENQGTGDGPGTESTGPVISPVSFKLSVFICPKA